MVDTGLFRLGVLSSAFLMQTAPLRDGQISQTGNPAGTSTSSTAQSRQSSRSSAIAATSALDGRIGRISAAIDDMGKTLSMLSRAESTAGNITQTLRDLRQKLLDGTSEASETRETTVMDVTPVNARRTGATALPAAGDLSSVLAGGQDGELSITIGQTTTTLTIAASATRTQVADQLNAVDGLSAAYDDQDRLTLEATNGQQLQIRNAETLADFGFSTNRTETLSRDVEVTDNALASGTKDLSTIASAQDYDAASLESGLEITIGTNPTVTVTRADAATLADYVTALDAVTGLSAMLDGSGALQLEAEGEQALDVRSTSNTMLDVLGLTATGTETVDLTRTVQDNAQLTGTTNIRDLTVLDDLAGTQDGASFDIQLGSAGSATRIDVTSTTTGQDLLDSLNAVANVSASFTAEGALRIEATDGSTLGLTDINGSLTNDLGITENSTQIVTTGDTNAAYATSITGTVDISSGKLEDLAGVSVGGQFDIQVEGAAGPTTITINSNDRSSALLSQLNAIANLTASLDGNGQLQISTDNGAGFTITEGPSLSLESLGIVENIRNPSTIEAEITGTIDLGTGRLRDVVGINQDDAFSLTVNGASTTLTIGQNTSADDLAASISAIDGVSATTTVNGELQITGQNGYRVELRNEVGTVLEGLGITLNDSEELPTASYTITASTTGSVVLNRNDRLSSVDGAFATGNLQIDITTDVGGTPITTPNTIIINENDRVRDLVDQINAIAGISASLNADDQLEIIADNDTTGFSLASIGSDVLSPLGLSAGDYDPVIVPPGTEDVAYASADSSVGPETRTVRVGSATANVTDREENYTEDWGIVQQTATQRTVTEDYQSDFLEVNPTTFTSFRTVNEPLAEGEESFDPAFEWETARLSIENDISLAISAGAVVLTGTSASVAGREGQSNGSVVRGQDLSIEGLGLSGLGDLLAANDIDGAITQIDQAIFQTSFAERQFSADSARIDLDSSIASALESRLGDQRASLFSVAAPQQTASNTGNQLAALQLALAGNRTDQLRSFA
ncbi:MAG: hypothetical protein JJ908_06560 [Rhizobiales bacterium]|nr:hypothetical protein [Hyphomicrobiales bacterium]MBO6697733.1 hypothetical protein [Hyphomicrobiales bacterium]MBO6736012.1 hypothetical protein [Hyphomicrobiales bacterium]MBO6912482.1 hypothetical protein [Hyphomicrobiales bacterium]MBO6955113.1 hypothetical protein [Hyphomicrobiales bacterium]